MSVGRVVQVCLMANEDPSSGVIYRGTGVNEQVRVSVNLSVYQSCQDESQMCVLVSCLSVSLPRGLSVRGTSVGLSGKSESERLRV